MTITSGADERSLDSASTIVEHDPSAFYRLLERLPEQARDAWALAHSWPLPPGFGTPSRVVLLGVGGSAIGADAVATLARLRSRIPVEVVRHYDAPPLDERALVIACSFSGESEEPIAALEGTLGRPGMRLAITTGGRLAREAEARGIPLLTYGWDGPPRTALGYGLFTTLGLLTRLGAIEMGEDEVAAAFDALADAADRYGLSARMNDAKRLAIAIGDGVPVVIGADFLDVAARRFASEVNENANHWAFSASLPEFDHNALQALAGDDRPLSLLVPILLDASVTHPRNRRRVQETARLMEQRGAAPRVIEFSADTPLEAIVRALSFASWTSYYLAMLHGVDPTPVATLDTLKKRMSQE